MAAKVAAQMGVGASHACDTYAAVAAEAVPAARERRAELDAALMAKYGVSSIDEARQKAAEAEEARRVTGGGGSEWVRVGVRGVSEGEQS